MATEVDTSLLLKLSAEKRLEIISILWDSLVDEDANVPISEAIIDEAEKRLDDLTDHPEKGVTYAEMKERRGWQ